MRATLLHVMKIVIAVMSLLKLCYKNNLKKNARKFHLKRIQLWFIILLVKSRYWYPRKLVIKIRMEIIFAYLCDFFAPDFMLCLQLETNLVLSFNVSFVCGVYGNRGIKMAYSIFCTSFTFNSITTRVFRGFVTLGVVGGE